MQQTAQLLDLGCGTGEHLNLLSREGFHCKGIDSSCEMIRFAKKRNPNIDFEVLDMTNFDFYEKFDVIVSLFGSFDYCVDEKDINSVLWNTRRALKPNSIAIFEIWNALPILKIRKKELSQVSTTYFDGKKIIRQRGFNVIEDNAFVAVRVDYRYEIYKGAEKDILNDTHIMRAYREDEFDKFVYENGFDVQAKFSSTLKEPVKENSNRLIYVIKKY